METAAFLWETGFVDLWVRHSTNDACDSVQIWNYKETKHHKTIKSSKLYEGTNIKNTIGLNDTQKDAIKALGAIEN